MNRARISTALLVVLLGLLLFITRDPLVPRQLFSEDEVNFAYSIGKLDTRISQPHPPGYPVFVMEMRILDKLRFKRPESNLRALAILAGGAALALIAILGNRMYGGSAGWWAAALLLFYPSFWYGGLTSAVRVHLAVVSLAVALCCWRLLQGAASRTLLYGSAVVLGLGSGIRAELGPLLLPLWTWSVYRGERSWGRRLDAAVILAASVGAWLWPVAAASGGFATYVRNTWLYTVDQVALAPTIGSEAEGAALATVSRLLVWAGAALPALLLPALVAWQKGEGFGFTRQHMVFLLMWGGPLVAFAAWVHLADPGHALAIVPVVCLFGARLVDRGIERWRGYSPRRETYAILILAFGLALGASLEHFEQFLLLLGLCVAVGLLLPKGGALSPQERPVWLAGLVLVLPALCWHAALFLQGGWAFRAPARVGTPFYARLWSQINTEVYAVNLGLVRAVTHSDHGVIQQVLDWIAERPGHAAVVSAGSQTHWRKLAYYMPQVPVIVVTRKAPFPDAPWVIKVSRGPQSEIRNEGALPLTLRVPAGSRLVWTLNPRTGLDEQLMDRLGAVCTPGGVCRVDVPEQHGSALAGDVRLEW